jgi:hypothetical protein
VATRAKKSSSSSGSLLLPVLGVAGLFVLVALVFAALNGPGSAKPGYLVQKGLYPLQLPMIQGEGAVAGSPVVLEFWRIDCPGCLESRKHLNELYARYRPRGLHIVGVTNDPPEELRRFQLRAPIKYGIAADPGDRYLDALSVGALPDAILLDGRGVMVWRGDPRALTEAEIEKVLR